VRVLVPFIGYALGRRFIGYVECDGGRLTDTLNRVESILVREAFVESFDDETVTNLGDGEIDRSIIYAVEAMGGRGDGVRRIHTVHQRLQLQLGPYAALGLLHSPGQIPLPIYDRGPMIPLTDATLGFTRRGVLVLRDVGALIVNRELVDWVRADETDAQAFPGVNVVTDPI
jgi:hypothetical protein